ncbi:N-acetyltransferase [Paenibacillus sp. PK3_47]|uniref:GNAT family N-acetyltransferase n=1 Tax=Paenibacillus sp. PK3_47 TaxID=2072642 RepID=UPI00201D5617|nr:GNAT family N-acetyltransferase [Paenibacillus sp. PK3_47]UQZ37249.1 N-acetyltransferase [Paenibacillus sp. PK3_47]
MDITIRELKEEDLDQGILLSGSFTVDSILVLHTENQQIRYTVQKVAAYTKSYDDEELTAGSHSDYIDNPDKVIYLAFAGKQAAGQLVLKRNWNNYAYIEYIKVDNSYRKSGIGRQLIEQAKHWAKAGDLPGLMLETQNINVTACKLYERCGFVIGGFDHFLYKGLHPQTNETAIYWYLLLDQ